MTRLVSHRGHEIRVIRNPFVPARPRVSRVAVACYGLVLAFALFVVTRVAGALA